MMYSINRTPLAAAMLLALSSPMYHPAANAVPGDAVGDEFLVNIYTTGTEFAPAVAMDADGDFVVVWQSYERANSEYGIYAQRFNADGMAAGNEFLVNTSTTTYFPKSPDVAMDADGDFVITWRGYPEVGSASIYAKRYSADGSALENEFLVSTDTTTFHRLPSIAMDADGDFVVAWENFDLDGSGNGIYARRYSADGSATGGAFLVNSYTTGYQSKPSIAMDADGDFVVVWEGAGLEDSSGGGVFARRYSTDGNPAGNQFIVNTFTSNSQSTPSIAMDADGDFVIAWQSSYQDGFFYGIYAQRYSADGNAIDNEFRVNTYTTSGQTRPSVAMDADGDFVISWQSYYQDDSYDGIYAQRYSAVGNAIDNEFQVNTYTINNQKSPRIAMDADGDFVVVWQSYDQSGGFGDDIHARRYLGAGEVIDLNLVVQDDTDPVKVGNNFVYSLITTNNGSGIAMDVNLSEPLPTGLTYVSDDAATSGWNCVTAAATLECNKPFMNAAEVGTVNVTVKADTAGTLSNTVTVSAAQTDVNAADNTDTETTKVNGAGGGGGSLGVFTLFLVLPLWLRRYLMS